MSENSHLHTIRLPLRKICSAVPAVALISGGIMLPASAAPTIASRIGLASASSPAVVVPATPLTQPGSPQNLDDPKAWRLAKPVGTQAIAQAVASMLPAGVAPGSSSAVTLDTSGIPVRALEGYRQAATVTNAADPSCHIDWALLGAIGRVESNHAQFGGNQLDAAGNAQPGIIGIPLDGSNGTARITDTDHGVLDRDTTFDRAVGPMQFIPGTWRAAGVDGNHDGVKNPENMADAAASTAVYLCSGPGDLRRPADLRSAILRYNASDSYVAMVIAIADAYRHGVKALPASAVAPVKLTTATERKSAAAIKHAKPTSGKPGARRPAATKAGTAKASTTTASKPGLTPQAPPTSVPTVTQVPPKTPPGTPLPTPSTSTPSTPSPTVTCVPVPPVTSTTATSTPSGAVSPTPTQTCLPPCAPTASGSSTASATASPAGTPTPVQTCLPPCVPAAAPTSTAPVAPALPCLPPAAAAASSKATP
jgi:hypothetical protein